MTSTQKIGAGIAVVVAVGLFIATRGDKAGGDTKPSTPLVVESVVPPTQTSPPSTVTPPTASVAATASAPGPAAATVNLGQAALEAQKVSAAQAALDRHDYKTAVKLIEEWESLPEHTVLTPQATMIKIDALSHVNRRTDALALAMSTRGDDRFKDYQDRIEAIVSDAGLVKEPAPAPPRP